MVEQLSTIHETHYEVQFIGSLKGEFEGDDERIVHQGEDGSLSKDVSNLSGSRGDVGLSDRFESIHPLGVFLPHLHHFSEGTLSDHRQEIERIDREGHVPGRFEIYFEVEGSRSGSCVIPLVGSMLGSQEEKKHVSPMCKEDERVMR